MDKGTLTITAMKVKRARLRWAQAQTKFASDMDALLTRLINEAAVNRMSAEEIAPLLGITPKRVRTLMRQQGLDPRMSKGMLAKHAAETLANNAVLLGIDVKDMDLATPLAYLPLGDALRAEILGESVSQVKDIPDDKVTRLAWLMWCYDQGYSNREDREILDDWISNPDEVMHPEDIKTRDNLIEMAREILGESVSKVTEIPEPPSHLTNEEAHAWTLGYEAAQR